MHGVRELFGGVMADFVNPVALVTLAVTFAAFTAFWAGSVLLRNTSVIDLYWAPGFLVVLGILVAATAARGANAAQTLMIVAVGLWGFRLTLHMGLRFVAAPHEDGRYARIRAEAGPNFALLSLPTVFWLQALILWIATSPIHAVFLSPNAQPVTALLWVGGILFAAGFLVETIADLQLAEFRRNPENAERTCTIGLWMYSRRPNYFGEALVWIGLGLAAAGGSSAWYALAGPAVLVLVMVFVSTPLTEAHLLASKRGYAEYRSRVSAFLPRKPRPRAAV